MNASKEHSTCSRMGPRRTFLHRLPIQWDGQNNAHERIKARPKASETC